MAAEPLRAPTKVPTLKSHEISEEELFRFCSIEEPLHSMQLLLIHILTPNTSKLPKAPILETK